MSNEKNRSIIYVFGGIFGALIGLTAVYLLDKANEIEGEDSLLSGKNLSKIGLGAISFLYPLIGKGKGRKGFLK